MREKGIVFTAETFRFFRELGRNNRKEWMDANRERYRAHVVEPFRNLLDQLTPVARKLNPEFEVSGRTGRNFSRINRDVRFAMDKSPYRTQFYLAFFDQRTDGWEGGQLYVGASADGATTGFRIYYDSRQGRLARIAAPRAMQHPAWLARQARRLRKKYQSYWYSSQKGEWTKHAGWPTQPDQWKRLKGWIVRRKIKPAAASRESFLPEVAGVFRELLPLYSFTSAEKWKG